MTVASVASFLCSVACLRGAAGEVRAGAVHANLPVSECLAAELKDISDHLAQRVPAPWLGLGMGEGLAWAGVPSFTLCRSVSCACFSLER